MISDCVLNKVRDQNQLASEERDEDYSKIL